MSYDLRVNLLRNGSTYKSNIMMQLDKMNALEAASFQGADTHFTYTAITINLPSIYGLVLFRDHMQDQVNIDPVTNALRVYLIISDPELHYIDGHWSFVCTRMRGT